MQKQVQPFIYTRNVGGHQKSFIIQTDKVTLTFQSACQKKPPTQGWRILNLQDITSFSKALVCADQIRICEQGQKFTLQLTCGITKKYTLQSFKSKEALNPEGISNLMRKQLQEDADYEQIRGGQSDNTCLRLCKISNLMILESLRLQEMAKHSPQDATKALNNGNKIFGGMVKSSIPPKCLMITSSSQDLQASIKKDQQEFRKHFPSANIIQTTKNPYTEAQIYNIIEKHYAQDPYSSERVYKIFYTGHGHFKGDLAAQNKNKQTLRIEQSPFLISGQSNRTWNKDASFTFILTPVSQADGFKGCKNIAKIAQNQRTLHFIVLLYVTKQALAIDLSEECTYTYTLTTKSVNKIRKR